MNPKRSVIRNALAVSVAVLSFAAYEAKAGIISVSEGAFQAGSGLITFDEFGLNTTNPTYTPGDYGGGAGAPTVTFGGFYTGQSLGTAATCPTGAALSGCVVGSPNDPLTLDPNSPDTFITTDGSFPSSPTLSGTPRFNGPISMIFSTDQFGVGLEGGFFDAVGGTAITAFDRNGGVIGSVSNTQTGIEFLGLVTDDNSESIAGLQFSLVGSEPFGYNIDNVRFGTTETVVTADVPLPGSVFLLGGALMMLGVGGRFLNRQAA
jgi:hypothetical protein